MVQTHKVFLRYFKLLEQVVRQVGFQFYIIGILYIFWLLVGLTVKIHNAVLDLQRLPGEPYAALDVVFAPVSRTVVTVSILVGIVNDVASPYGVEHFKVVPLLLWV